MPEATSTKFTTGHVGLNVSDINRSKEFYEQVFGWRSLRSGEHEGSQYAFLGEGETLIVTLWQQSDGSFSASTPGLHHLAFIVDGVDEIQALSKRVSSFGTRIYHEGIVPHEAGGSSAGLFFEDPDGIRLEVYTRSGSHTHGNAPYGQAPTCGFF